ncbi:WD40 repeat domain-containing protein [Streptomyces europaeiscabiei]|uniref:WD40 repeat domain-containing protein n=1 Tax=Streptomyces europaeiscabiei TaxID=146819 RepID=UPI0029AC4A8A|nr:WD40 repeat domain-containing protein [Streptomyces europaeiscabiei]MDX3585401.1 WD40 repeat domain-containing protein [Streptomyces europaeiscabiei]MDX3613775.1 WD40 repeat domain-containing protein [Streptomyces europaeiscabiei]
MNVDELVRDSLREQAAEQQPLGPGFADRVLTARRRRRNRSIATVAAATAAVVAVAVAVPLLDSGRDEVRLATEMNRSDIIAHPDQSPPRDLIAAGDVAMAAWYTLETVKTSKDTAVSARAYWILDQETGKYVKDTRWSQVAVAPGMRTAAVLEKDLPARRIGLLDLLTGEVERWIPVDRGVASVDFSSDGGRLVATTYSKNPDALTVAGNDVDGDGKKNDFIPNWSESYRTGFYLVDIDSGRTKWSEVPPEKDDDVPIVNPRQDFSFSRDGQLVRSGLAVEPHDQYYDLQGNKVAKPANEKYLTWSVKARLSPDGKLAAGGFAGGVRTTASEIIDPYTGKRLHKIRGQQLLTWVDNKRLIAWDIKAGDNEFHSALVLVTIGSDRTIALSGALKGNDGAPGRWNPVFATR